MDPANLQTIDKKSPFLKAHMRDGSLYVLSEWQMIQDVHAIHGKGVHLGPNRDVLAKGRFTITLDSVALFETNVKKMSPAIAALAILTGASVALTAACAANPKACFGSCPTFYAWDGARYALKAEGFSSSISPSLEATDPNHIRLRLTRGLWRLDAVALAPIEREVDPTRLSPRSIEKIGRDEHRSDESAPGRQIITHPGEEYALTYELPPGEQEHELFLESRGYYLEWIRKEWLVDENLFHARMMLREPERALQVLAPQYKTWEKEMDKLFWESRYANR